MARVSGTYQSVTRGVSQQVPQDRRPGQHWEQLNMLADPVRGAARRRGSVLQAELAVAGYTLAGYNATVEDTAGFREFTFFFNGVEHSLIYRKAAKVTNSLAPLCWCFNKDTGAFLNVSLSADSVVTALTNGGISSMVAVGRFLYVAGNTVVPTVTTNNAWAALANARKTSIWIRGGTYSRTFTVKCRRASGATTTFSYKTLSSAYGGTLDTSGIAAADPEYQKKVNDLTSAYNTAVTQWLGTANADIQPENIAEQLRLAAAAVGLTGTRIGSHLVFDDTQTITEVEVSDGGDGSFIRGVTAEVASPDLLTNVHYAGKVVRVLPKRNNEEDAYYLKAQPKVQGATGWVEVTWRECAGVEYTPTSVFGFATINDAGTTFCLSGTAAGLASLSGATVPGFATSAAGDAISSPVPELFGNRVDYLGLFQDRLVVGSGSVLLFSRPGDYLNWWRTSVLTVDDRDPVEMFAIGSEDDTITCGTTYDRNLVLFGRRKQYAINGRQVLTPLNQSITIMSAHEDATSAFPVNSGNLVFFGKQQGQTTSLHQIQIGAVADSPEAYEVSQQLDTYLQGVPTEIRALTAPNMVVLRTSTIRNGLYIYAYLDAVSGERLFDAWSRWEWHECLGVVAGIASHDSDVLVFTVREGLDKDGVRKVFIAADTFSSEGSLSGTPYLDSQRSYAAYNAPTSNTWLHAGAVATADASAAYSAGTDEEFLGAPVVRVQELLDEFGTSTGLMVGVNYDAYVVPTNPFMRDREGKAKLAGRLTLSTVLASLSDSGGMAAYVTHNGVERQALQFTGRVAGSVNAMVGRQPIVTRSVQFTIGREVRECQYRIAAIKWLPMTLTALEWKGQNFNNS